MSQLRSPTGSGLGKSDSQPNLTEGDWRKDFPETSQVTQRKKPRIEKRKIEEGDITMQEDLTEIRSQMTKMMEVLTTVSINQTQFMTKISDELTFIKSQITEIKSITDSLKSEQNTLKGNVTNLMEKTAAIELKIITLESDVQEKSIMISGAEINLQETVVAELYERTQRAKNIIITNVPEPMTVEKNERKTCDTMEVVKILQSIQENCPKPERTFRLGKYNPDKNRLIKVCLKSEEEAKNILRNKDKLKYDREVKIYSDQTPQQQINFKKLIEELKKRTESGEQNLVIKYIKGVPKIIQEPPKNLN